MRVRDVFFSPMSVQNVHILSIKAPNVYVIQNGHPTFCHVCTHTHSFKIQWAIRQAHREKNPFQYEMLILLKLSSLLQIYMFSVYTYTHIMISLVVYYVFVHQMK